MPRTLAAAVLALAPAAAPAADPAAPDLDGFRARVAPFLKAHCLACHEGAKAKGQLALDAIDPDLLAGRDADKWREVVDRLNAGDMPPKEKPRPPAAELQAAIDWATGELRKAEKAAAAKGGRHPLRRLNRTEYRNTVRDLLGLPIDAAQFLPEDAATHGFDTVAGGLTVSPLHAETYLDAAERALDLALESRPAPPRQHWRAEFLDPVGAVPGPDPRAHRRKPDPATYHVKPGRFEGKGKVFDYDGKMFYKEVIEAFVVYPPHHDVVDLTPAEPRRWARFTDLMFSSFTPVYPQGGELGQTTLSIRQFNYDPGVYAVRIRARAFLPEQWQGDSPTLTVRLEPEGQVVKRVALGPDPQTVELTVYRESIPEYRQRYNQQRSFGLTLLYPSRMPVDPAEAKQFGYLSDEELKRKGAISPDRVTRASRIMVPAGVHVESVEVEGPVYDVWPPKHHRDVLFDRPPGATDGEYARAVIRRFATRAFRRPAADPEVERLGKLFDQLRAGGADFLAAVKPPLAAVLASPSFLYVVEPAAGAKPRPLTGHELASRLSYFLWSAPPDDELLTLAAAGKLSTDAALRQQVRRMLADPRGRAFVENFAGHWLRLRKFRDFQPERLLYPEFDEGLRAALVGETEAFFAEVLGKNLSVLNFLDSDWAMLNRTTARHYGVPGVTGPEFRRVALTPEDGRGGVLTQASVLAVTTNGIRTLPVQRGVFVLEELLGDPPPPPPPNAGQLDDVAAGPEKLTVKKRLEAHRADATCAACHRKIDPYGFALEGYDVIGRRRTAEKLLVEETHPAAGGQVRVVRRVKTGDPVDTSAELPSGKAFRDVAGFKRLLLDDKDRFVGCLAEKLLVYALGRGLDFADRPLVASVSAACQADDYRFRALIEAVVLSDAFRTK